MDTFKHAMAFPMFATVVWLVWVLGQQSGIDGAGALLALLLGLALVIWSLTLRGRSRVIIATLSIASLALLTGAIGPNVLKLSDATAATSSTERWQPWAPGRVEQTLATGVPVFVDFTAAWCVTCQYNKKTTLVNADVLADFDAKSVTLPSPPRCSNWGAMACRCTCSTKPGAHPWCCQRFWVWTRCGKRWRRYEWFASMVRHSGERFIMPP
jgi:thiol:disulfide interchange protein DsbD